MEEKRYPVKEKRRDERREIFCTQVLYKYFPPFGINAIERSLSNPISKLSKNPKTLSSENQKLRIKKKKNTRQFFFLILLLLVDEIEEEEEEEENWNEK